MRYRTWNVWAVGAMVYAIVLLAGCATDKQAKTPAPMTRPVASLQSTRLELVKADQQVDETLVALNRLAESQSSVPQAYKVYTTEVSQTSAQSQQARERSQQMDSQWRQYIDAWERELNTLTTPELRTSAAQRSQDVSEHYDRLREAARQTRAAYQPFITQLQEIQRTLLLDTTPAGVQAVQPAFEVTRKSAANLKQQIHDFIAEIDKVATAPATPTAVGSAAGQ